MIYQILSFLLEVAAGLLGGACLLRLYMQAQRVPFSNPLGRFVFALTDWLILPLRKLVPSWGRWDSASLLAAWLVKLMQFALLALLFASAASLVWVPVLALFGVVQIAISGLVVLLIVYVILSWVQTESPVALVVERLCKPLLAPLRRRLPLIGGIDVAPLVALVLLQIAAMVLASLQRSVLLG